MLQHLFIGFGIAAVSTWCVCMVASETYQAWQGSRLDRALRQLQLKSAEEPGTGRAQSIEAGLPLGRIELPRLGVDAIVVEGIDTRSLLLGVGHLPGTARPGEAGNVVIAGHRDTFFRPLRQIKKDDEIRFVTSRGVFVYRVESIQIVPPGRTDLLARTADPTLTLVTCYPFGWIGPAPKRFIVQAMPVERTPPPSS